MTSFGDVHEKRKYRNYAFSRAGDAKFARVPFHEFRPVDNFYADAEVAGRWA